MVAFSDFYGSHGPTPSGNARGIVPVHHQMVRKVDTFCIFVLFAVTLVAARAIRSQ